MSDFLVVFSEGGGVHSFADLTQTHTLSSPDGFFDGVAWSRDESYFVYIAEQKVPKGQAEGSFRSVV